jgi:alcohol dehydrogenase (cytochrome c)
MALLIKKKYLLLFIIILFLSSFFIGFYYIKDRLTQIKFLVKKTAYSFYSYNQEIISDPFYISNDQLLNAGQQTNDWLLVHGNYSQNRTFPGDQINTENVKNLQLVSKLSTEVFGPIEAAPLVVNGIAYFTTAYNHIFAFDAVSGDQIWHFKYFNDKGDNYPYNCCGAINRGLAISGDRLFMGTLDGHLVCISAKTGRLIWNVSLLTDQELIEWKNSYAVNNISGSPFLHYSATSAPVVIENKVIIGIGDGDYPIRGFIKSFDVSNGNNLWTFYTIPNNGQEGVWAKKDVIGQPLFRNIEKEKELLKLPHFRKNLHLGAGVWSTPAIDLTRRKIFFVTGNAYPNWDGDKRPGDNLYSNSLIALDLDTGEYKWHYQYVPHDIWNLDSASPPILTKLNQRGQITPVVLHANKLGNIFIHDRDNGKLISISEPMIPQTKRTPKNENERIKGSSIPDGESGVNWNPMALNEKNNIIYAMNRVKEPSKFDVNNNHIYSGTLAAVSLINGKIIWKFDDKLPMQGGVLYTHGDLVFFGSGDGNFYSLNALTGEKLWQFNCDAGANGVPAAFTKNNKQYIIIGCGGNEIKNFKKGDSYYVFSL